MGASESSGGDSGKGGGGYAIPGKSAGKKQKNKRKAMSSVAGQVRRTQYEAADKFKSRVDDPNDMQAQMMMAAGGSEYQRVGNQNFARNLRLADELDMKSRSNQYNIPGTAGAAISGMTSMNQRNQAKQLRAGGSPVFANLGGNQVKTPSVLVGVESRGALGGEVYSGRSEFNPLKRVDSGFDLSSGSYGTQKEGIRSERDSSVRLKPAFQPNSSDDPVRTTSSDPTLDASPDISVSSSGPTGAQRALGLLDNSGGTKNRYFMGRR